MRPFGEVVVSPIKKPVYQFMEKKRSEGKPYRAYDGVYKQVFTHLLRVCDGVSKRLNQGLYIQTPYELATPSIIVSLGGLN